MFFGSPKQTAVNVEGLASNSGRAVRAEERHHVADVGWSSGATERGHGSDAFYRGLSIADAPWFFLLCVGIGLDNSKDIAGGICGIGKPADIRDSHLRHTDFSAALLDHLDRSV